MHPLYHFRGRLRGNEALGESALRSTTQTAPASKAPARPSQPSPKGNGAGDEVSSSFSKFLSFVHQGKAADPSNLRASPEESVGGIFDMLNSADADFKVGFVKSSF